MTIESDEEQPLLNPSSNQSLPDVTYLKTAMRQHYGDLFLTFICFTGIGAGTTYSSADANEASVHPISPVLSFVATLLLLGIVLSDFARKRKSELLEHLYAREDLRPLRAKMDYQKLILCFSGIIKGCFAVLSILNKSASYGLIAGSGLLLGAGGTYFWRVTKDDQEKIRQSLSDNSPAP